ncbi:MAG: hypothetical protein HN720_14300, partial [Nitrospinaceae bacterium]|nr:hypothetical protein [Nitrospinaceae bacterium]
KSIFKALCETIAADRPDEQVTVVDVGCSYGINGAILKYDISMDDLYRRYGSHEANDLTRAELLSSDREMLDHCPRNENFNVIGLDTSEEAVHYAMEAGYLDQGIVANLEQEELTPREAEIIQNADMIISTGCVGYVTENTFTSLLKSFKTDALPWVASFVLRMFPYDSIIHKLDGKGLFTEKLLEHEFVQRDFESDEEKSHVIERLKAIEIDPAGKEAGGKYYADFFLSRPEDEIKENPLSDILEGNVAYKPQVMLLAQ